MFFYFSTEPDSVGDCLVFELNEIKPANQELDKFMDYLVETYIEDDAPFPPAIWASKSASSTRTTNACESFHAHLNKCFNYSHPNIFVFLDVIQNYQSEVYIQIQSIQKYQKVQSKTLKRENYLKEKISQLDHNQITLLQYIKLTSHYYSF